MGIFNKIKKWLTKKPKNEKVKEANRVTNYGGGVSSKSVQKEVRRSIVKAEAKKQTEYQQSAVSKSSSSAFKAMPPSAKKAEAKDRQTSKKSDPFNRKNAFKAGSLPKTSNERLQEQMNLNIKARQTSAPKTSAQPKLAHQSTALGTMSKRDIDTRTAKMNAYNENRKYQSRAADKLKPLIDAKYDPNTKEGRQRIKSGEYQSDPNVMKYETLKHPIAMSAGRGALSGATFGLSELGIALLPQSKEVEEAERLYQANKSKGAEFAGEMAGSLLGFGLTGGASKAAVKGVAPKLTAKMGASATERLAGNRLVMDAARREALRKLGTTATEEEIARLARSKAAKIVAALGEDAAINLTTGAVSDVSHAIIDSDNPAEFVKNMGVSAGMNLLLGGATSALPALRGSSIDDAVGDAVSRTVRNVDNTDTTIGRAARDIEPSAPKVETPKAEIEPKAETTVKAESPKRKPTKTEIKRDELRKEYQALQERYEAAKNAGEDTSDIVTDMQETDLLIKDAERKIAKADKARETRAANKAKAANDSQMNLEDEMAKPPAQEKSTPPQTAKQKKIAEAKERSMLDEVQRKREANMASDIRRQTGGEYSYRQGEHTSTANASIDEARRIENEQKSVYKKLKEKGVKELFVDESQPFGVFKTANREEMNRVAGEAAERVRTDPKAVMDRLREKEARLLKEADKSALTSAEHITFDDIADITAIEQMFEEAGTALPPEYEEAFSHIIEWQGTEAGQMLKMRDLFLKETSPAYRHKLLTRDVDKYLRKVLGADDKGIAEIKRSIDANYGEGYFDKMLKELSNFHGAESEAEFRKAYAEFQKQLFANSKPTVWDVVNLVRHTFMLSAPKTGGNNMLGNINQRIMYDISDAVNMPAERLAQKINPDVKRTTAVLKSKDQLRLANMITSGKVGGRNVKNASYLTGFKDQKFADAINRAADADVGEMMDSSKYMGDVAKGSKFKGTSAGDKLKAGAMKIGGYGQKYVSLMLNEPDSWFVEKNYRTTLLKYLEANGVNSFESLSTKEGEKVLEAARNYAKDVALENTYKKANELVSFLEGLRKKGYVKGSNPLYKVITITLDAELPYLKVPVNLIINNFKYSPAGLSKGAFDAFRALSNGDAELLNEATRELSKGLTGTGMMYLGYLARCRNQSDDDSVGFIGNANDELKEYGIKDNSFKIGNHLFNISNMGIGSTQYLMGAALGEDLDENGKTPPYQVVFDAMAKNLDVEADMSLMENATGLLDILGNGGDYNMKMSERLGKAGTEIAGDYVGQFIVNPARGAARAYTDADLDTGIKKGDKENKTSQTERIIQRNLNNIVSGVPYVNEHGIKAIGFEGLPHKVDSHGNLINERKTTKDKNLALLNNTLNPLTHTKVKVPEADKIELKVKDDKGNPYKPKPFDQDRTYVAKIGKGDSAERIELTGKEREQAARSVKKSGKDMARAIVYSKAGFVGDSHSKRAQQILNDCPEDEEKAREYLYNLPEYKKLKTDEQRVKFMDALYYGGYQSGGAKNYGGRERTSNKAVYVDIKGHTEDEFRFKNDLSESEQSNYDKFNLEKRGVAKGTFVDAVEAVHAAEHEYKNGENIDTINSKKNIIAGIKALELTTEENIAIYDALRGNRKWKDWDGISDVSSGWHRWGYGGWHSWGSYQRKGRKPSNEMPSGFKAKKANISGGSKVSAPNVSGGINTKGTASRMSTSPKINITPLDIKTVRANSGKSRRSSNNLSAALEDIQRTEKKVTPPKARRSR